MKPTVAVDLDQKQGEPMEDFGTYPEAVYLTRPVVYISGPITADTPAKMSHNVELADERFRPLFDAGFSVHCPHWSYHSKWAHSANSRMTHEEWMQNDLPILERYDAILRIPGYSKGADIECDHARACGIPVYVEQDDLVRDRDKLVRRRPFQTGQFALAVTETTVAKANGQGDFRAVLDELDAMQARKGKDYGTDEDPLANLRASEAFGIPAWQGAIIRGNDKMRRLQTFIRKGSLVNESVEDSLLDLAVYAVHSLRLFREESQ